MSQAKNKKIALSYLLGTVFIIFLTYYSSLFRPWQPFDERLFYNEEFLPIPGSFKEAIEVIKLFVLNNHIVSMNSFFSNHLLLRSDPIAWSLLTFILFFFKKSAFLYHSFQLGLHLINIILLWLVLYNLTPSKGKKTSLGNPKCFLISVLAAIWGLHSANIEAVLLTMNWNAVLIYSFCFGFILYETSQILKESRKNSLLESIAIALLFCFSMSVAEFGYTLPIVLFLIMFSLLIKKSNTIKDSFYISLKRILPYLLGLGLYLLYSAIKPDSLFRNILLVQKTAYVIERNLWLSPQIFVHFLKLLFFPKTLSTYQSNLIHLSDYLVSPYSSFCSLIYLSFLVIPLVLFIKYIKSKNAFFWLLLYSFYFSLFPFLHIITPSYCLIADRYCYFPSFILIILLHQFLDIPNFKNTKAILICLSLLLITLYIRTSIRINEWNNPQIFFQSAVSADNNPLYKAQKLLILANYADLETNRLLKEDSINKSIGLLNKSIEIYSSKERRIEPVTLQIYGLDSKSLLLKTAYLISTVKNDYYNENPKSILSFYEPHIKEQFNNAGINELLLYASILSKNGKLINTKEVLEFALRKYPCSPEAMKSLANIYFYEKDFTKLKKVLHRAYELFPSDKDFIKMLYIYYKLVNDHKNEEKFAYLIRLREHLIVSTK